MAILGGSPLGLIGLKSIANPSTGMSTFNGGMTRNVDVYDYNRSRAGTLFSGKRRLRAWPNISGKIIPASVDKDGKETTQEDYDTLGTYDVKFTGSQSSISMIDGYTSPFDGDDWKDKSKAKSHKGQNVLHNNDVYDTSVLNIIEKLSMTKGALRPADFAYLKDLGVYPNNRLMVCRRFITPSTDNIMVNNANKDGRAKDVPSLASMISWIPENDPFLSITFGEVWEDAKADFTGMLNSLGEDFGKTNAGGIAGAVGGALPLPGFTEIFQREFLEKFGVLDTGAGASIPAGNPNLIKEAKVRTTVPYGSAGSGLATTLSIVMVCEYELKFISGIDPTIVWMDILGTITRFGTSNSANYGLSDKIASKLAKWARNPNSLLVDVINALGEIIEKVKEKVKAELERVRKAALALVPTSQETKAAEESTDPTKDDPYWIAKRAGDATKKVGERILGALLEGINKSISASIMKYRVQVMGIVASLTGNPSTPWHLTIGNPLRPVFCSGDMLVKSTKLTLGPILAFNDLPSTITAEFTIENARSWGMQEIMAKFNSGYLRTVDVQKTFFETQHYFSGDEANGEKWDGSEPAGILPGEPFTLPVSEVKTPENAEPKVLDEATVTAKRNPKFAPQGPENIELTPANSNNTALTEAPGVGLNSVNAAGTGPVVNTLVDGGTPTEPMKLITIPEDVKTGAAPGSAVTAAGVTGEVVAAANTGGVPGAVVAATNTATVPGTATGLVPVQLGPQLGAQSKQLGGIWP